MCRMLVIATILSLRSYRHQTSHLRLFHISSYLLANLWGCAPFLIMGLCPLKLSFPGALLPAMASAHSAVSTATIVRVSRTVCRSIVLSTSLSRPLPTSWFMRGLAIGPNTAAGTPRVPRRGARRELHACTCPPLISCSPKCWTLLPGGGLNNDVVVLY